MAANVVGAVWDVRGLIWLNDARCRRCAFRSSLGLRPNQHMCYLCRRETSDLRKQFEGRYRRAWQGQACVRCGDAAQVMDHIIPLALGGTNDPSNVQPMCSPCNRAKGTAL